jgi:hypothetical protein
MSRILGLVVLATALTSATANAQAPLAPFAGLVDHLSIGDSVTVTTAAGTTHQGRLRGLSDTALVLRTEGADLTLPAHGVVRIVRREHHIRNGMLIGFASGFVIGAVLALRADDCTVTCFSSPAGMASWGGLGGGAGLAVGALVGSARPRSSVVYDAETRAARITVIPEVGPRHAAVRVTWSGAR